MSGDKRQQEGKWGYKELQGLTRVYMGLQGVTKGDYKRFQGVRGGYKAS